MTSPTPPAATRHHVFVDFENVPKIDLDAIAAAPAVVTLFIGKHQTKVDTELFDQAVRHAARLKIVRLESAGRNALDLVIAHYLGRTVIETPQTELHIVSRDKDFDPLIAHLRGKGVKVARSDSFAELPFLNAKKRGRPRAAASRSGSTVAAAKTPANAAAAASASAPNGTLTAAKLEKLALRLQTNPSHRPKTRESLLHHINTTGGLALTPAAQAEVVAELESRGVLRLDGEKVIYGAAPAGGSPTAE
jgi:hypothetical protein